MRRLLALAVSFGLTALAAASPALGQTQTTSDQQAELQIGQQEYQALQQKGEILSSSPDYAILNPIAQQIKRVADPQYFMPFKFILVHETQPNAFAVPGGNVYVTDSLMKFVQNREELAGVLCHETSHTIHHDVLNLYKKEQKTALGYTLGDIAINILTGGRAQNTVNQATNVIFTLQTQGFSREVESAADHKGAQTCAAAGSNPWGMIWLFQQFEKADTGGQMEMLSDHPSDQHRIDDLKREFASDPATFGRYSSNIAYATPLGRAPRSTGAAATHATANRSPRKNGMYPPGSGYKF
ncbi:MAG: M48 family metallopeptidase [Candidatus Elarobacter sp.]